MRAQLKVVPFFFRQLLLGCVEKLQYVWMTLQFCVLMLQSMPQPVGGLKYRSMLRSWDGTQSKCWRQDNTAIQDRPWTYGRQWVVIWKASHHCHNLWSIDYRCHLLPRDSLLWSRRLILAYRVQKISPWNQAIQKRRNMAYSSSSIAQKIVASQVLIRSVAPSDQENLAKVPTRVAVRWIHKVIW